MAYHRSRLLRCSMVVRKRLWPGGCDGSGCWRLSGVSLDWVAQSVGANRWQSRDFKSPRNMRDVAWAPTDSCSIAIIVVLSQYDGKEPPEWPLGITLNTFLAFFTSFAKVALLIPVLEGLGQLRWLWFKSGARQAADFELFEEACRGTFGSLRLLLSLKGGWVCTSHGR
jgi:hypothetical protein